MSLIIFAIILAAAVYLTRSKNKIIPVGQISDEPLTGNEKIAVWILCLLTPVISGAIFYFGWRKRLPEKAREAVQISLWAFLVLVIVWILGSITGFTK